MCIRIMHNSINPFHSNETTTNIKLFFFYILGHVGCWLNDDSSYIFHALNANVFLLANLEYIVTIEHTKKDEKDWKTFNKFYFDWVEWFSWTIQTAISIFFYALQYKWTGI